MVIDPLIATRTVHFASTIMVAGAAAFSILVAEPIWQRAGGGPSGLASSAAPHIARLLWVNLIVAIASGAVWLVLLAANIAGAPWTEAIRDGTAWMLLTETQFGFVWQLRLVGAIVLAGLLLLPRWHEGWKSYWHRSLIAVVAALGLGALAWAGHAGAASGAGGWLHLLADVLHLLAAGAWVGGLVPLLIVVAIASTNQDLVPEAFQALYRFSNLGVVGVAALLGSGIVNTWFLTDRMRGLIGTEYGRLLQIKLALFLALICVAAVNRLRLLPRLSQADDAVSQSALRQLRRNVAIEIALGFAVLGVVGTLGMTPPAGHHH